MSNIKQEIIAIIMKETIKQKKIKMQEKSTKILAIIMKFNGLNFVFTTQESFILCMHMYLPVFFFRSNTPKTQDSNRGQ